MNEAQITPCSSMGFFGWLCLLFIGLKLTGHIHWPWLWVLSPLWIELTIALAILAYITAKD